MDSLQHTLFFDIETAPLQPRFDDLPEGLQDHWTRKAVSLKRGEPGDAAALFPERAGVYAEFARVVCIGIGCLQGEADTRPIRLKAFYDTDEAALLEAFCETVSALVKSWGAPVRLCGHNIREFDVPFLCRRMVVHGMHLPDCLQVQGKKPWELKHLDDTLELWKYGDTKSYTSLALLAEVLGLPSPKDDMDGADVGRVFWEERDTARIARYCLKDVLTTAQVFLRLTGRNEIVLSPDYAQPELQS